MSDVDICNKALSELGKGPLISSMTEQSPAAVQCRLHYNSLREQLLRAAPWGFSRKTLTLTTLGLLTDDPPASPYPWLVKYLYPADCLKMRYILPPPWPNSDVNPNVSQGQVTAWCAPSRAWRYLVSYDDTVSPPRRVILSNVTSALAVYTVNVTDTALFDPLFENALVMALASKFCMPLTGNVSLKGSYSQMADAAILQARVADGNEAIPTTDHRVDWIATRMVGDWGGAWGLGQTGVLGLGDWYGGYDNMNWGM